jgi:hypothetical protein
MMPAMRALALLAAGLLGCGGSVQGASDGGTPDGGTPSVDAAGPDATEVTITVTVEGPGTVTSDPASIDGCRATCTEGFSSGTSVVLTATPLPGATFTGWTGGCTGADTCTVSSSASVVATFEGPNYVFVTSTEIPMPFGGLDGADARCNELADGAGLPGAYVAYLSTSTTDPLTRLAGSRGWIRTDGKPFVDTLADLEAGHILYPPRLDEEGRPVEGVVTITGTGRTGRLVGLTCADWTDATRAETPFGGDPSGGSNMFSLFYSQPCAVPAHLYCFGVGVDHALPTPVVNGRRAFLTTGPWAPGGGLDSADALCQDDAEGASLAGTYKAFLAPTGASAVSRFNTAGLPWVRPDGYPLAPAAEETFSGAHLDVSVNMTADGATFFGNSCVWSGAEGPNVEGSAASNCQGWSSTAGTGWQGLAGMTRFEEVLGWSSDNGCDTVCRLICLQE